MTGKLSSAFSTFNKGLLIAAAVGMARHAYLDSQKREENDEIERIEEEQAERAKEKRREIDAYVPYGYYDSDRDNVDFVERYETAVDFCIETGGIITIARLQKELGMGFARTCTCIEIMEREGIVRMCNDSFGRPYEVVVLRSHKNDPPPEEKPELSLWQKYVKWLNA